ncbi:MAG: hypothetical protein ABNH00_07455 [Dokdonia sp.]|jgi:uncharacterized tellurite resistance protein B-like protein
MNSKISHIKNLVHFAYIDNELHESEKKFIHHVGIRLGIEKNDIENELNSPPTSSPDLPTDEVLRFILLDDIINVITSDGIIQEQEVSECKKVAKDLGFEVSLVDTLLNKLLSHIENGFIENKTSLLIKSEVYKLTSKNYSDAKYD